EQALLNVLPANLVFLDAASELGPLTLAPPQLADFLVCLIPLKHREGLLGDLEEDYWNTLVPRHGLKKARFLYWVQALYELARFVARPLAGIAGLGFIRKLIEVLIHRMMK